MIRSRGPRPEDRECPAQGAVEETGPALSVNERLQRRAGRVHAADGCAENPAQRYAADRSSCGADSAAVRAERRRDGRAGKHSGIEQATAGSWRAAALGGGSALVVALAIIAFLFFPSSKPLAVVATKTAPTQPAATVAVQTPAPPAAVAPHTSQAPTAPVSSATPATATGSAPAPIAKTPVDTTPSLDPATLPGPLADIVVAANRGDPAAQNQLAVKYAQGEDPIPRNDIKAVDLYRQAANQGFAKAETNLGDMYFYGRGGLAQSYSDAASWYLKAAQQEWPDAQYRLAYMYEKGIGSDKDVQRAVQLYRSAAEHGYPEAQNLLGILYATGGDGLTEDDKQAITWYQKAADQGFAKAEKNCRRYIFLRPRHRQGLQTGHDLVRQSRRSAIRRRPIPAWLHV